MKTKQQGALGKLDRAAVKVAEAYTKTDEFNRWWSFKHALAGMDRDINLYRNGKIGYKTFAKRQGLGSMTDLELKHIFSLKPEDARLQIARFITEKTQVRYKKFERGFGALSELGEVATSLQQFPKSVMARYIDSIRMIAHGRTFAERKAGLQLLAGYLVMPIVANYMLQKATGTKKYYNPDTRREGNICTLWILSICYWVFIWRSSSESDKRLLQSCWSYSRDNEVEYAGRV